MSTNLPPAGPPSSSETLERGGGAPVPPGTGTTGAGGGRRRGLIIGAVVGAVAVGGAAFGAYTWLTSTGPQPAEGLPADTLGYVSIDLDPSGSQKIAALKTLEKFPAADEWLDDEGIGSGEDLRKVLFAKIQEDEGACEGVDFDADIEPWLGDRFAIAAIDGGEGEAPVPLGVVELNDADGAEERVEEVVEACGGDPNAAGLAVNGDWLILAETDDIAQEVADDAAESTLADDEDFQKWTEAAGDPGILTAYVSPDAGRVLGDELGGLAGGDPFGVTECAPGEPEFEGCLSDEGSAPVLPDEVGDLFDDFGGLAVTVRFDDGSLEVEMAGDTTAAGLGSFASSDAGAEVVSTLPSDTAAAFGLGFEPGWAQELLDYIATVSGAESSIEGFVEQAEAELDLSLPEDLETLLGESAALAVGSDFDVEAMANSSSGIFELPIGVKIQGDPDEIEEVLDKVKATAPTPEDAEIFTTESEGDHIAIGPNADYLTELLDDGGLGDSETYQDVVREDDPSSILFVDFDAGDEWLSDLAGEDDQVKENLDPLSGLGITGWQDDGIGHAVLRLTTD